MTCCSKCEFMTYDENGLLINDCPGKCPCHSKDEESKTVSQCCGYPMFWSDGIILTCHKCQKETQPKDDGLERVLREFDKKFSSDWFMGFTTQEDLNKLGIGGIKSFITQVYKEAKEEERERIRKELPKELTGTMINNSFVEGQCYDNGFHDCLAQVKKII